ncbi:protein of unknown function DUF445 [Anaerovibrio sp. JC8]|uniref:DUF445 domain-containing protein n=1 Tax=Anaerovibrio sp. JC8 TaxID=1240085 RepID=UPI000A0BA3D3|nr:DUF445 domain-containing protein [Anaerovibrio sp. JC8]ORU00325.1 protein of unknown function DUF445 [Anaerovibrio sp. JC8]
MKKKYKATVALAISVLGAGATMSWPSAYGFWGGMLHNGFLAATIGGMADWFAVTAIFRKPLGISYKTEIIIRNRQRIMDAIVEFVGHDLLSTENVMQFVNKQDVAELLARYIDAQGKERLSVLAEETARVIIRDIDTLTMAKRVTPFIKETVDGKIIPAVSNDIMERLSNREISDVILRCLLDAGEDILKEEALASILRENVGEFLKKYEGDGMGRGFVMGLMGIDREKVTGLLLNKAGNWIDSVRNDEEKWQKLSQWMLERMQLLCQNQRLRDNLEEKLCGLSSEERIEAMVNNYLAGVISSREIGDKVHKAAQDFLEKFVENHEWKQKMDTVIKAWMAKELENNHHTITNMIEERLKGLSDEELVEFTEEKVADDLQMIRINGSVVGSLAGMALYIVVYLAGQVIHP